MDYASSSSRSGRGTVVRGVIAPPREGERKDQRPDEEIREVGNSLLNPPSSTDELLALLMKAEIILIWVRQLPSDSTRQALLPAMKALISDIYLRQTDENIQIVVASCLNEIVRITTPDHPYENDKMKEVFQLFMSGLKHLSSESRNNYIRAVRILEILAALGTCLIMLDFDTDAMIVEMFQFFFNAIRPHHPVKVFRLMERAMTLIIEKSKNDEISLELLRPLLDSVKLDNENTLAQFLGKSVIDRCTTKLQPHLKAAVKSLNLEVKDYAEIVASLCQEDTSNDNMVPEFIEGFVAEPSKLDRNSDAEQNNCIPQEGNNPSTLNHVRDETAAVAPSGSDLSKSNGVSDAEREDFTIQVRDGEANLLHDENQQTVQLESINARSDAGAVCYTNNYQVPELILGFVSEPSKQDGNSEAEQDNCIPQEGNNPSTVNHVGEENAAVAPSGSDASKVGGASDGEREDCTLQVKDGAVGNEGNLLHGENQQTVELESIDARSDVEAVGNAERLQSEMDAIIAHGRRRVRKPNSRLRPEEGYQHPWTIGSIGRKRRSKNKESTLNQQSDQELHSGLRKKIVQSKVKAGGSNIQENSTNRVATGSSTVSVDKGEGSGSGLQSLGKESRDVVAEMVESPIPEPAKEIRDVVDQMVESPLLEPAKENYTGTLASEELSRGSNVAYGEEMVNLRIMVWWPMDKTFYTGTVESFDPLTKKHKIIYDDDDEEVLDLREERWEPFNEEPRQIQSSQNEEAEDPSPPKEPAMTEKKVIKRKIGSSKKQLAPASSKRSKSEDLGLIKCGASASSPRQLEKERDKDDDDNDDEMDEPIFSFKYGKGRIGKKTA